MRLRVCTAMCVVAVSCAFGRSADAGVPTVVPVTRAHPSLVSDTALGYHGGPLAVSQDGRYVAFVASSPNLLAGYVAGFFGVRDIYLLDRATGAMTLVSHHADTPLRGGDGWSRDPVISADGRWVAYISDARDLVAGLTGAGDGNIFLFDRSTGENRLVSHRAGGPLVGAGGCGEVRLSADGAQIAFESTARDLVTGQSDVSNTADVFLYDVLADSTRLVSYSTTGPATTTNRVASLDGLSADGRRVVFATDSTNVVPGQVDTNASEDVFLFDLDAGGTALVSHVPGLALVAADGTSNGASLSADGAYVAFTSNATNLVAGQSGPLYGTQVILALLANGTATLVSHAASGPAVAASGFSRTPLVSADGTTVAFESSAFDLIAGTNVFGDNVYAFDRASGANTIVSATAGPTGVGGHLVGLSADGRRVAYESRGNPGGFNDVNNSDLDVFVYDRPTASTHLASATASSPDTTANGESTRATLAADGARVAFVTSATDSVPSIVDGNESDDVVVNDDIATALVSRRDPTTPPTTALQGGYARPGAISDDGRWVVFNSTSHDLVPGQVPSTTFAVGNVFLFDRLSGAVTLLSHAAGAPLVEAGGSDPWISGDGAYVAFASDAPLVPGQIGSGMQTFLLERATGTLRLVSHAAGATTVGANNSSYPLGVTRNGGRVLINTTATNLAPGVTDGSFSYDLYLYDRASDTNTLVTHVAGSSTTTPSVSFYDDAVLAADGTRVAYTHTATDLVAGQIDTNSYLDVFLYDRASGLTQLVSRSAASATTTANNGSFGDISISGDGRRVAWVSGSTNVVVGQSGAGVLDVFLFDRVSGTNRLVSHAVGQAAQGANSSSYNARVSRNGNVVAYDSYADDLVSAVTDRGGRDAFLYDVATDTSILLSHAAGVPLTTALGASMSPVPSADGATVVFESNASDLVAGQVVGIGSCCDNAFRYSRVNGESVLASRVWSTATTTAGGVDSYNHVTQISADGATVLFQSEANTLVPGDFNEGDDVFLFAAAHTKGDFSDDLHVDLVLRHLSQPVNRVWTLDGEGNRLAEVDITPDQTSVDWRLLGVDDFDGDLDSDLVFRNVNTGAVEFWMMNGTARQGAPVPLGTPAPDLTWELSATGDFSHDGQPDLLWRNVGTRQLSIWVMNGVTPTGTITPSPSQAVDANWTVVAALDLDLDGNRDMLWYNTSSGRIVRWLMDAQVQRTSGQFTNPAQAGDANWRVLAGGDYGVGPGGVPNTQDLVWRNSTSGRFVIWFMDTDGNRASGRFTNPVAPDSPLNWTIAGPR